MLLRQRHIIELRMKAQRHNHDALRDDDARSDDVAQPQCRNMSGSAGAASARAAACRDALVAFDMRRCRYAMP